MQSGGADAHTRRSAGVVLSDYYFNSVKKLDARLMLANILLAMTALASCSNAELPGQGKL